MAASANGLPRSDAWSEALLSLSLLSSGLRICTEGSLPDSSTDPLSRPTRGLQSLLLVSALLERGDLLALGRCLAASDRHLEWSVSEDLPELVECLRSSVYLLDCDWSCVPGELCLDLFFVSSVLLALYTSATSGAFFLQSRPA